MAIYVLRRMAFFVAAVLVGAGAAVSGLLLGAVAGLTAAGAGRLADEVLTRAADILLSIPGMVTALVLAASLGPGALTTIAALTVFFTPSFTRVVPAAAIAVLLEDFVPAARLYGRGRLFVLVRHVLPNIAGVITVQLTPCFAAGILTGMERPTGGTVLFGGSDLWAGGQASRLRLHRAVQVVLQNPRSSLDPRMRIGTSLLEPLRSLRITGDHAARVLIAHDLSVVAYTTSRVSAIAGGHIVEVGRPLDLFTRPRSDATRALVDSVLTIDAGLAGTALD